MQLLRKSLASILAVWVILMSSGFTFNAHFCGGMLSNWSIFSEASDCGHANETSPQCPLEAQFSQQSCCADQSTFYKSIDDGFEIISFKVKQWPQAAILFPLAQLVPFQNILSSSQRTYHQYSPPLIDQDISVLVQSFLL